MSTRSEIAEFNETGRANALSDIEDSKGLTRIFDSAKSVMSGVPQVTIIIPLPPRILSPNCPTASFRGRMMRAAAAKKQKRIAKESAEDAMRGERWERASVRAVFYHKTKRRRDDVNALAMLKSAYDGIVMAGLIPDDDRSHLRTEGAEFAIDRDWPRVELVFTKEA